MNEAVPGALLAEGLRLFAPLSQQARLLKLHTALPEASLVVERAVIDEAVNAPFEIEADVLSPQAHFELRDLLGQQITVQLLCSDGGYRPWHGYVLQAADLGSDGGFARYRLSMRPWLSFLAHRRDSFMYQDKTALQIVEDVFRDHPQAHWRVQVSEPLRKRSLCSQYKESDLEFITRLLAEEGLSYHFEHLTGQAAQDADSAKKARHCLVITDRQAPRESLGPVRFATGHDLAQNSAAWQVDTLTQLSAAQSAGTNATVLGAWNYKHLAGTAAQDTSTLDHGPLPPLSHYDGAGAYRYETTEHAQRAATLALQRHEQHYHRLLGSGSVRFARPGADIDLTEHASLDGAYTVVAVRHEALNNLGAQAAHLLERPELEAGQYRSDLLAQPAPIPVLPEYTRKPTAPGLQSALVVGVSREPLTTERDQRIKVQFPWQRGQTPNPGGLPHDSASPDTAGNAPGSDTSGTWVRVAQPSAGANWGSLYTPRVGTEVLVDFIDADIDRPLVVGQLHNGHDTPPFSAGKDSNANHPGTIDGIHSPTLNRDGYNEWSLDNATGQLRMRLLCSYSAAEVGLGHLIQQTPASATRGAARGAGFEVNTQGWSSLRASQGLLISTSARAGSYASAQSTQMDVAEAVAQLKAAQDLGQRLNEPTQALKAQTLKPHDKSVPEFVKALDPTQDGKHAGPVNGQDARKADAQRNPTDPVERPANPSIVLDSASALAQASEGQIAGFAGQDQAWASQGDWHEAAGHTLAMVAGGTASWYVHEQGIQLKAGNGDVSLRAHADELQILAERDVQIASVGDEITIDAKTRIELVGGASKIVLDGANIEFVTPGAFTVKAATHDWQSAGGDAAQIEALPQGLAGRLVHFVEVERLYFDASPVQGAPVKVTFVDGSVRSGKLSSDGRARIDGVPSGPATIEIGEDERAWTPDPTEELVANPAYGKQLTAAQSAELYEMFFGKGAA